MKRVLTVSKIVKTVALISFVPPTLIVFDQFLLISKALFYHCRFCGILLLAVHYHHIWAKNRENQVDDMVKILQEKVQMSNDMTEKMN